MGRYIHQAVSARQPYPGELTNKDPISSVLARIGQASRLTRDRYMDMHGRHYAGFGSDVSLNDPFPGKPNVGDMQYADTEAMDALEAEDDVAGSGIFDEPGRRSTIHSTLGVFADHPSLPGYAAREQPFAVSQDVTDPIHHADVVYIPAGGMTVVERGGHTVDYLDRDRSVPPALPAITETEEAAPAPEQIMANGMTASQLAAAQAAAAAAPSADASAPIGAPSAASGFGFALGDMAFARMFQPTRLARPLPVRSIVNPLQLRQAVGADAVAPPVPTPPAAGWKTYAAVGVIGGVAAAIFFGTLKIKPSKTKRR